MTILEELKKQLGITDTSQDYNLNYSINISKIKIDKYLRLRTDFNDTIKNDDFEKKFFYQIVELSKYTFKNMNNTTDSNIKAYTQGDRSVTYRDSVINSIPQEIRDMLPYPSLRMY